VAEQSIQRYAYTARNAQGELVSGTIAADSETGAARRLQAMGLAALSLRAGAKQGGSRFSLADLDPRNRRKKVRAKHLAMFSRQFSTMISAGLPLVRAMNALAKQTEHPELQRVLPLVRADIESGSSFSAALAKHPTVFPTLLVGMVGAGEVSGTLGAALDRVADSYDKDAQLRSRVVSAMTYPVIVLAMAALMVTGMMLFVVPRFAKVFADLGAELPLPTQILIGISQAAVFVVPLLVVGGVFFSVWWGKHKNDDKIRDFIDPLKLRIPVIGPFLKKILIARFARTFGSLLASGVPIIQTLDIVSATAGSSVITKAMLEVKEAVRSGKPVNGTMEQHKVFPPLVVQMVSTGEETGALPDMLTRVAGFYEDEVRTTSEQLSAIIEPVLLIFLAVIVGGMVIALYLPIFSIYSALQT
jgi:type IV pilus assembly protein PilC